MIGQRTEPRARTAAGLAVLSRAEWPDGPGDTAAAIPGFILSSFSPLVIEAAERCLRPHYGEPPAPPARAARTALVLASTGWDRGTARALAAARGGSRVPPLLFFQSNPNAVLGHIAARWGLGGPVVCVGPEPVRPRERAPDPAAAPAPAGDALTTALSEAALLLGAGEADDALVIAAEQAGRPEETDSAVAVLVTRDRGPGAGAPEGPGTRPQ